MLEQASRLLALHFPYSPGSCRSHSGVGTHLSYSLNSLKGGFIGDYIGDYYRGY